ncbi:hypothetical protein FD27_GL000199 [Limosilactobacillus frumenti DSM 13145]|uniref:Uncharacterized protein n=1 Tax=Limosilactobacillus frumenti DSM 13145 TaxID=1423746 RepID=A0A0R1P801_9LACO|nr:hypothetical protein [Limosilactobacillus frumenti]KRL28313.1 hypothetical protein FD27_GL000199 [Limosilactobacillus frumenti DSM 13145]MBA2914650.1 hypothetical protein [Limosilactobacillus frumenti]QFG72929.1 hypothetical protein LF145_06190 [Limosilactobacillus frumenti]
MNIRNILIIVGIIAVILLIFQYIVQVRRIKAGDNYVSGGRAFLNWLLLFVIVGSFGGSVYANHRAKNEQAVPTDIASSSSPEEENDQLYVNFDKAKARLNDDGVAPMKLIVSPGTKVKIVGHRSGTVYKKFTTKKGDGPVTVKYKFEYAAEYDIIATKNGKKITKHLTVKDQETESSSSSSSSISSSSSSHSSSNSSSSANHTSNNGGPSSNNGGSNSSNTSGSYTPSRSYGGGYTGNTSGGRPAISNQPMINNQPIQNQ